MSRPPCCPCAFFSDPFSRPVEGLLTADSASSGSIRLLGAHALNTGDKVALQFSGDTGTTFVRHDMSVDGVDGQQINVSGGSGGNLAGMVSDKALVSAKLSEADCRVQLGGDTTLRDYLRRPGKRFLLDWSRGSREEMRLGTSSSYYPFPTTVRLLGGHGSSIPAEGTQATLRPQPMVSVFPNRAKVGEPWSIETGQWWIEQSETSSFGGDGSVSTLRYELHGSGDAPKITLGPTLLAPSQQISVAVRPLHGQTYRIHFARDYAAEFIFGTVDEEELGRARLIGPSGVIAEDVAWSLNLDFSSGRPNPGVALTVSVWYETDGDPINVTLTYGRWSTIVTKRLAMLQAEDLEEGEIALSGDGAGEDLCFGSFSVTRIEQDGCTAATRLCNLVLRDDMPRYLRLTLGGYSGSSELQQLINREHLLLHDGGCSWGLQESGPANATGVDAPAFVSTQYGLWLYYSGSRCQLLLELYSSAAAGINGRWVTDLGTDKPDLRNLINLVLTPDPQFGGVDEGMTATVSAEFDDTKPPPIDQYCGALTFEDAEPQEYLVSVRGFTACPELNGDFLVRRLQRLGAAGSLWSYDEDLGSGSSRTVWMYLYNWQAIVYVWKTSPGSTMSGTYQPYAVIFHKSDDAPFPPPDDDIPYCFSAQTIPPFYHSYPIDPDQSGSTCHISLVEND